MPSPSGEVQSREWLFERPTRLKPRSMACRRFSLRETKAYDFPGVYTLSKVSQREPTTVSQLM
jgi:hypothetical protein